jgi:hypothetical protein
MRKLALLIGLVVAVLGGLALTWTLQTRALAEALVKDLSVAKASVIERTPPARAPLHENGFACVGAMMDVTAADFAPFYGKDSAGLKEFITGQRPISELAPEVKTKMQAFSAWASSLRACGDSAKLVYVDGITPWAQPQQPRTARLADAIPALIEFTALELRVLIADGQPEVALERCSATWAMVADQSHLGLLGALHARMAVRRLAPACAEALAAAKPDVRAQAATQWAPLVSRLAPAHELIELERLNISLLVYARVSPESLSTQLGVTPTQADLRGRVAVGRMWRAWDEAMRKLIGLADVPGTARVDAATSVDATRDLNVSMQYAKFLGAYEETTLLLGVLTELAAGGAKPLPAGVTKTARGLEYDNGDGQKLLIPTAP